MPSWRRPGDTPDHPSSAVRRRLRADSGDARRVTALDRVSVEFQQGQFTAIMGPSGSGKSTLMQCLAGLDSPTSGSARIGTMELARLSDRLGYRPGELSGGQQQRVACARALAGCPEIVFADEPTGNLDTRTGAEVLSLLGQLVREMGQTIVMVTHDPAAAAYADRVVFLADGRIVDDLWRPGTGQLLERMNRFDGPRGPRGR
ncbi:ABC transporter ATP-binding protein [Kitasatospora sp. NPDC048286]|uniref:ABC transporter ATP-binding protein n=1 Tax=Kitasatospora sp. NPDC048286 TaxID=3364047 RepID=UPI0037174DCA